MKNLKKYKNGIIYNIITVNGSQPRPTRRQKTTPQQNQYNPQIRGIQYLAPPPPSYADYGMSRFNTGNAYNNNVQDQYLREKVQALENRFNESNNLPMIEDLQSQINNLGDQQDNLAEQQFQQRQNLINAGSYMLDFQNHINDRFDRIKAPFSFEDSAGSIAETGGDSSFIPQIGNDRQDLLDYQNEEEDDESPSPISTPLIIDKRRNFTHPRNYEQLQISNEPFYQQRNEDEFFESPLTEEEKQESKQAEIIEHQEQPPPPEIQKTPPTEVYIDYETLIQRYINLGGVDDSIIESYNPSVVKRAIDKLTQQKEEESKKQLTAEDIKFRPSESQEEIKPLLQDIDEGEKIVKDKKEPIVEDVEDDEEEEEDVKPAEKDVKPAKKKVGRKSKVEEIAEFKRLENEYKEITGKNANTTSITILKDRLKKAEKAETTTERAKRLERRNLIKEYEENGGKDNAILMSKNNEDIKKAVDFQIKRLKNITDQYRMLDGYDERILTSTNYDLIKGAYDELLKQQPKESPVKKGTWGGYRPGAGRKKK